MRTTRTLTLTLIALFAIAALAIGGCAASTSQDGSDSAAEKPATMPAPAADMASREMAAGSGGIVTGAKIAQSADITLWVDDVEVAAAEVAQVADRHEGEVTDSRLGTGGYYPPIPYASSDASEIDDGWVTVKVPADRLEAALDDIRAIGNVRSVGVSARDVTTEHVDLTARLDNLKASEARMRELLARTDNVADAIAVESELSRLRSEIDSLEGQLRYMDDQVDMSTISVTLTKTPSPGTAFADFDLRELLANALRGALKGVEWMLTVAIALIPIAIVIWIIVAIVRAIRRKKR